MGWGGSVHAMITSLKYNNSQLRKKRIFPDLKERLKKETNKRIYSQLSGKLQTDLEAAQVKEIVEQIKSEMRKRNKRLNALTWLVSMLVLVFISVLMYQLLG